MPQKPNIVNSMSIAAQHGLNVEERHDSREVYIVDSIRVELETDTGVSIVERRAGTEQGAAAARGRHPVRGGAGHLLHLKNTDVLGVNRPHRQRTEEELDQHHELLARPSGSGRAGAQPAGRGGDHRDGIFGVAVLENVEGLKVAKQTIPDSKWPD